MTEDYREYVAAERSDTTPHCLAVPDSDCTRTDLTGGQVAMSDLVNQPDGRSQQTVTVYRDDDTRVTVAVIGLREAIPSVASLIQLARSSTLTLYP